jgi:heme oxygenase
MAHRRAEEAPFVRAFFRGDVTREAFAQLNARLYHVYLALEDALDEHRLHPVIAPLCFSELRRVGPLRSDLDHLLGGGWSRRTGRSVEARQYAQRIREVSNDDPALLVAHAYTRYLGDLSGGQVIATAAQRFFGLDADRGLSFFHFPEIRDLKAFKHEYRKRLDSLDLSEESKALVVAEANRSFALNRALTDEVWSEHSADSKGANQRQLP